MSTVMIAPVGGGQVFAPQSTMRTEANSASLFGGGTMKDWLLLAIVVIVGATFLTGGLGTGPGNLPGFFSPLSAASSVLGIMVSLMTSILGPFAFAMFYLIKKGAFGVLGQAVWNGFGWLKARVPKIPSVVFAKDSAKYKEAAKAADTARGKLKSTNKGLDPELKKAQTLLKIIRKYGANSVDIINAKNGKAVVQAIMEDKTLIATDVDKKALDDILKDKSGKPDVSAYFTKLNKILQVAPGLDGEGEKLFEDAVNSHRMQAFVRASTIDKYMVLGGDDQPNQFKETIKGYNVSIDDNSKGAERFLRILIRNPSLMDNYRKLANMAGEMEIFQDNTLSTQLNKMLSAKFEEENLKMSSDDFEKIMRTIKTFDPKQSLVEEKGIQQMLGEFKEGTLGQAATKIRTELNTPDSTLKRAMSAGINAAARSTRQMIASVAKHFKL